MTEKPVIKIEHLNLGMLRGDSEKQILKDINLEIGPQEPFTAIFPVRRLCLPPL